MLDAIYFNICLPFVFIFNKYNTFEPASIFYTEPLVMSILLMCCKPQIFTSIV